MTLVEMRTTGYLQYGGWTNIFCTFNRYSASVLVLADEFQISPHRKYLIRCTQIMKTLLLLVLLLTAFVYDTKSQSLQPDIAKQQKQFQKSVSRHFQYIDSVRRVDPDLVEAENKKLEQTLNKFRHIVFSSSDTLDFDWLYIVKSSDKDFCLISWDTRMGGTMIEYATMAFFKDTSGKVQSKMLVEKSSDGFANSMMHYDTIHTIQSSGRTLYIAHGFGQGSTALPWQELRAFSIKNNGLINPNIFPEKKSNIFVEFDTHKFKDGQRIPTIKVKSSGKTILVPIATDNEGFSGKYKTLVFNGQVYKAK